MTIAIEHAVRLAGRALARHQLVHAYGHVSARVEDGQFVVTPAHPLGRLRLDAPLVRGPIAGALPDGALPEVRIHQAIYAARPDVGGICRFQSRGVLALAAVGRAPRALHGLGAYFAPSPPLRTDPMLVRDPERAAAVAVELGAGRAIVLRGNGAVTVGSTVREAACHAFFLEDAAQVELAAALTGELPLEYTPDEATRRSAPDPGLYARMWEFLVADDASAVEVRA